MTSGAIERSNRLVYHSKNKESNHRIETVNEGSSKEGTFAGRGPTRIKFARLYESTLQWGTPPPAPVI